MARVFRIFLLLLTVVSSESYMYSNKIVLENEGNYNVSYKFDASSDTLEFLVEARATGWVGFGVAETAPNSMRDYDVGIGGVLSNGTGYLKDYLTMGYRLDIPQDAIGDHFGIGKRSIISGENEELDVQQDWMLLNSSEENGITMLRFNRKLNPTDQEKDVVIQRGVSIFVMWAYHSTSDVDPEIPQIFGCPELQHTARGYQKITFIAATATTETTSTPKAATTSVIPSVTPSLHFPNVVSFENIDFNLSWKITGNANSIKFVAEVKAAGIIFGVTNQAPNNTVAYNVFLEGKLTGPAQVVASVFMSNSACHRETVESTTTVTSTTTTTATLPTTSLVSTHASNSQQVSVESSITPTSASAMNTTPATSLVSTHASNSQQASVESSITPTSASAMNTTPGTSTQFTLSFDNNRLLFRWEFDDQNDKISFSLRVNTTGWVGFGFSKIAPNNMQDYDVIVGGFKDGQGYLNDYYTQGPFQPRPDTNQDYKLLSASEMEGYTEIMFERPRDTNDRNDTQFKPGDQVFIVWAYAIQDITTAADFAQHSNRGWSDGTVILIPVSPIPTKANNEATPLNSSIFGIVSIAIVFVNIFLECLI